MFAGVWFDCGLNYSIVVFGVLFVGTNLCVGLWRLCCGFMFAERTFDY